MASASDGNFPTTFGLFYSRPGLDYLSQHFELALRQEEGSTEPRQVLHAITFHKAPGAGQMTLYSTPQHGSAPLAIAVNERRYSSSASIILPGGDGSNLNNTEHLRHTGFGVNAKDAFHFHGEDFEWRQDSNSNPTIRRLVRPRSPSTPASLSTPDGNAPRLEGSTSLAGERDAIDERLLKPATGSRPEVLATWTEGSVPNRQGMIAAIKFADNGIAAALGEYFVLLAVSSVLFACQNGRAIDSEYRGAGAANRQPSSMKMC